MKFNICLMQPAGYIHALGLLEVAEYFLHRLLRLGHHAELVKNRIIHDGINIIIGSHVYPDRYIDLPTNTVIFNSEQLPENSTWTSIAYKQLLEKHYVLDYSKSNLTCIQHENKDLIEFYYESKLNRITHSHPKVWDLIFYGSMNDRRKQIIDNLIQSGLRVKVLLGIYAKERDYFISQSRAVLNCVSPI